MLVDERLVAKNEHRGDAADEQARRAERRGDERAVPMG
jgi:hypothetical protein